MFIKKEIKVEFPRIVYPKTQESWDGKDYSKLKFARVESLEEYKALEGEYVLDFKQVTNIVKPKRKAPAKKQPKLEV